MFGFAVFEIAGVRARLLTLGDELVVGEQPDRTSDGRAGETVAFDELVVSKVAGAKERAVFVLLLQAVNGGANGELGLAELAGLAVLVCREAHEVVGHAKKAAMRAACTIEFSVCVCHNNDSFN